VETLLRPLELTPFTLASRRLSIMVALLVVAVLVLTVEPDTDPRVEEVRATLLRLVPLTVPDDLRPEDTKELRDP
jgi:hypothetical protein